MPTRITDAYKLATQAVEVLDVASARHHQLDDVRILHDVGDGDVVGVDDGVVHGVDGEEGSADAERVFVTGEQLVVVVDVVDAVIGLYNQIVKVQNVFAFNYLLHIYAFSLASSHKLLVVKLGSKKI